MTFGHVGYIFFILNEINRKLTFTYNHEAILKHTYSEDMYIRLKGTRPIPEEGQLTYVEMECLKILLKSKDYSVVVDKNEKPDLYFIHSILVRKGVIAVDEKKCWKWYNFHILFILSHHNTVINHEDIWQ